MSEVAEEKDVKLEDILKSIRGIIDDHNPNPTNEMNASDSADIVQEDDAILELTNLAPGQGHVMPSEGLVSERTKEKIESQINEFVEHLGKASYQSQENPLDSTVNQLMRPLVKAWLDDNLPRIVERVVTEEIQKMIPKR